MTLPPLVSVDITQMNKSLLYSLPQFWMCFFPQELDPFPGILKLILQRIVSHPAQLSSQPYYTNVFLIPFPVRKELFKLLRVLFADIIGFPRVFGNVKHLP